MDKEEIGYALAKQTSTMESINTNYGTIELDEELKEAVKKTLEKILKKRLSKK